jgi:hypothetical protein
VVRDAAGAEALLDGDEVRLIARGEGDGVGVGGETAGAGLARGVDQLRCLDPARDVSADDAVVREISGKVETWLLG